LQPNLDAHIWLLHHLFLDAIEWAEAWNHHHLHVPGGGQQSPREMFFFGMIQNGARGYEPTLLSGDNDVDDIQEYRIDWEDYDNDDIQNYHNNTNTTDSDDHAQNPFFTH
jgi:hypothetical protein